MKQPIEWHRQYLKNQMRTLKESEDHIARLRKDIKRLSDDVEFYKEQIREAEKRGKEGFDRERYLVKRAAGE